MANLSCFIDINYSINLLYRPEFSQSTHLSICLQAAAAGTIKRCLAGHYKGNAGQRCLLACTAAEMERVQKGTRKGF